MAEHDLDAVASFVAPLVISDGLFAGLPTGDADLYPLVFQRFSEPVSVIASVGEQPPRLRQAAQQRRRASIIADLPGGHVEPDRPPLRIRDSVQLGVHATFGSSDLARSPPFLTRRLDAVRCALR
ncbi:hypothetical protein SDC9_42638 [bioreactor metagenome]|uniref:Uncharacterized protein n=1 Tax=bioreactor metagenome TaxID=1076179 RepID=A0A644VYS6_9ZZZZ